MSITSSLLRIFVISTIGAFAAGCSGTQTSSNPAPGPPLSPQQNQLAVFPGAPRSEKCQNSPGLHVTPCYLVFTKNHPKFLSVDDAGSGIARVFDNCQRLATIFEASGPAWVVAPKKAKGTCAAVFIYKGQFAILTIVDEL